MITGIRLENFLAFQDVSLQISPLTLLTGANSAGKTSILRSLAVLRQSHRAAMLPHALLLNGDSVRLGTGQDVLYSEPKKIAGVETVACSIELSEGSRSTRWLISYQRDADTLKSSQANDWLDNGLFGEAFQYLSADRIAPAVTFPKSHEAVVVQRTLGTRGQHTPNYLRVHGGAPISAKGLIHPQASGRTLLEQTNAWLSELSAGTFLGVRDVPSTDFVRLEFQRLGTDVKTNPQRATNVGFGLTYALPIVVACLSARPGTLILLENPEAHLHPRGQSLVGRLCALAAQAGAQVIVESHSDHVLNAIRLAIKDGELDAEGCVLQYFSRKVGVLQPAAQAIRVGSDGSVAEWPKGFFDEMDRALTELLSQ